MLTIFFLLFSERNFFSNNLPIKICNFTIKIAFLDPKIKPETRPKPDIGYPKPTRTRKKNQNPTRPEPEKNFKTRTRPEPDIWQPDPSLALTNLIAVFSDFRPAKLLEVETDEICQKIFSLNYYLTQFDCK